MTYSRQEIVALALEEFGIPGAGQTAGAEDAAKVDDRFEAVMADLSRRDVWPFGDPDQIEDEAALHIATILAQASAGAFDEKPDEAKRLLAESRLRALNSTMLSGQRQTAEYY